MTTTPSMPGPPSIRQPRLAFSSCHLPLARRLYERVVWRQLANDAKLVIPRLVPMLRIEQPVHVYNEVAHVSVVDRLLGLRLQGRIGGRIVGIDADDVELVEIPELDIGELLEHHAKNEVEQLLERSFVRHGRSSSSVIGSRTPTQLTASHALHALAPGDCAQPAHRPAPSPG